MGKDLWLTDPTVPCASQVWAKKETLFGTRVREVWMPHEPSYWFDSRSYRIFFVPPGDITDFASTPVGDGHLGVLRGAGRIHDTFNKPTNVLRLPIDANKVSMSYKLEALSVTCDPFDLAGQLWRLGWRRETTKIGIMEGASIYQRMLVSSDFPCIRSVLHFSCLILFQRMYGMYNKTDWNLLL